MAPFERDIERIEKILASAWREKESSSGERWQNDLMNEIRRMPLGGETEGNPWLFNGMAWRLSLAAGVVTAVLLVYSFYSGLFTEMDLSLLFFNDPGGFIVSPPLG